MNLIIKTCFLAFFMFCLFLPVVSFANTFELDIDEARKIQKVCTSFHKALKRKNIEDLVSLAAPDKRLGVKKYLEEEGSDLYGSLVDPKLEEFSCWNDFISITDIKFRIERMVEGANVNLLLYDGSKYKAVDLTDDYINENKICNIMSIFLFKLDDSYYVSFQYFFNEDY